MDVRLPDGTTIKGVPDGMSQADLVTKLQANGHDVSWYKPPAESPEPEKSSSPLAPISSFASGVNRGALAALPGIPGDLVANVLDLGIAGYGTAKRAIGGPGTEMPDTLNRANLPLTSAWLNKQLNKTPIVSPQSEQQFPGLNAAGTAVGASMAPGTTPAGLGVAGLSGLAGQKTAEMTGRNDAGMLASLATPLPFGASRIQNTKPLNTREQTFKSAQDEGMVVAPAEFEHSLLEGIGGKIKTQQVASQRNQQVVNKLAAEYLDLPPKTEITTPVLEGIRKDAGKAYEAVKKQGGQIAPDAQYANEALGLSKVADRIRIDFPNAKLTAQDDIGKLSEGLLAFDKTGAAKSFSAEGAIEYVKRLRSDARANLRAGDDPNKLALGTAQKSAADAIEGLVERNLTQQGKQDLMTAYRDARVQIAKTHTVEDALNSSTANVSARKLSKAPYITEGLKKAADFAAAFPKSNQPPEMIGGVPSVSPLDVYGSVGASSLGTLAAGPGGGLLASGIPLARNLAIPMALSKANQRSLLGRQAPPDFGILPLTMPGLLAGQDGRS